MLGVTSMQFSEDSNEKDQNGYTVEAIDPNGPRHYKAITVSLNKYEYLQLKEAAAVTKHTMCGFIRCSIDRYASEVL